jgi:hypothetical protein
MSNNSSTRTLNIIEHLNPPVYIGVRVIQTFAFCVAVCRALSVLQTFLFYNNKNKSGDALSCTYIELFVSLIISSEMRSSSCSTNDTRRVTLVMLSYAQFRFLFILCFFISSTNYGCKWTWETIHLYSWTLTDKENYRSVGRRFWRSWHPLSVVLELGISDSLR